MKKNSNITYRQTLRAFIRRVIVMLFRRGITTRAAIVEVLRCLRQRGIWPVKAKVQKAVEHSEVAFYKNENHKTEASGISDKKRPENSTITFSYWTRWLISDLLLGIFFTQRKLRDASLYGLAERLYVLFVFVHIAFEDG